MLEEETRRIPQTPDAIRAMSYLGRPIEPDEVAAACVYLCSPAAVAVSGAGLLVDCGVTAGPVGV